MIRDKSETKLMRGAPSLKKTISSRINGPTYDKMRDAIEDPNHRFYDRTIGYIVKEVLDDWAQKEK
tara:strand:+ start:31 stop:228 length:198 start_codon:yes stop_codon:yes gene_type:complete